MTVKDVARAERLHHSTVKDLAKLYMAEQLRRHPMPATSAIGVDEISIRKGHDYRVVVSDLIGQRPIWFGGAGRKEEDLAQFFAAYGRRRCAGIEVVVMDMWKPFRQAMRTHAPKASIVFDKFHILRHLNEALDAVRRCEYARVQGEQRRFIKGSRYTLLSHRENLSVNGTYWYEHYNSQDWHLDGVSANTISNVLAFGEQPPSYYANVVMLSLRYKF